MKRQLREAITSLFLVNLAVKKRERVLVMTDTVRNRDALSRERAGEWADLLKLTGEVADVGSDYSKCRFLAYPSVGAHGAEPPREVWEAAFGSGPVAELERRGLFSPILDKSITPPLFKRVEEIVAGGKDSKRIDVVIAMTRFSTSHTRFRGLLCGLLDVRYASMPLFERSMFAGPMRVDWKELAEKTEALAAAVRGGSEVKIDAPNGTDLTIAIKGRPVFADTGIIDRPGGFSNLPAGEVFLAPLEGRTEGRLVLEWAPTRKLASPVTLTIREGVVTRVAGKEPYADELRKVLRKNRDFRNIAELGIGTNERALRPDNILESEKILGTIHIALGDNATFGGKVKTPFHQDYVLFDPTVTLTKRGRKREIVKERRLIIEE